METFGTIKVDYCKTADLIPYAANSRTHSEQQVAQIAASIKEFGFTNPILTDGGNGIIAGHGRLLAARKLGLVEVPTIALAGLTAAQKRAYVIADNKLALNAGWDDLSLESELRGLDDSDFNLALLGFDVAELSAMLGNAECGELPHLVSGDREPFQQMTFTLHDSQTEDVKRAIELAKGSGPFVESPNENSNGNALARICETYNTRGLPNA